MKRRNIILIFVLLASIAITYANSLRGVFIFDDYGQILSNPYIKDFKNIPVIFKSGFGRLNITGANYYRPVLEFSYTIDYFLWKNDAAGYHLTNIFLHAFSAVILFLLLNRLFKNVKISFLTALIFGVHPIYTSGVTYISGRGDSMVIFFLLLSLFFYAKYMISSKGGFEFLLLSCMAFLAALLTKEIALFFLLVIALFGFFPFGAPQGRKRNSKLIAAYISFFTITLFYIFARTNALNAVFTPQYNIAARVSVLARFLTMIKVFGAYLLLLFWPVGLHFERTIPIAKSIFDPWVPISLAVLIFSIFIFVKSSRKKGPVFYGILWYFINFIPISNIFLPLNAFIAENWIQLPAIGFFLAVAAFTVWIHEAPAKNAFFKTLYKLAIPLFIVATIFYSILTIARNREYADEVLFYESALRYEPKATKLYNNLGVVWERKGDLKKAEELYKKALEISPNHPTSLANLASIYSGEGRQDEAISMYKKALELDKNNIKYLNNLGVAYIRKGDKKNAVYYWRESLAINPDQPQIKQYIEWNEPN